MNQIEKILNLTLGIGTIEGFEFAQTITGVPEAAKEIKEYFLTIEPSRRFQPYTNDFVNMLVVNALRNLTDEQRMELTKALFSRLSKDHQKRVLEFKREGV